MLKKKLKIESERHRKKIYFFIAEWLKNIPELKERLITTTPNLSLESIEEGLVNLLEKGDFRIVMNKRGTCYAASYNCRSKKYTYKDVKDIEHTVTTEEFIDPSKVKFY